MKCEQGGEEIDSRAGTGRGGAEAAGIGHPRPRVPVWGKRLFVSNFPIFFLDLGLCLELKSIESLFRGPTEAVR
jgi:hypothetical protein